MVSHPGAREVPVAPARSCAGWLAHPSPSHRFWPIRPHMLRMPATIAKVRGWPVTHSRATRIRATPSAVAYLVRNIVFTGRLPVPVLTMHTTGDGLVVPENEQAYRARPALQHLPGGHHHRAGCTGVPALPARPYLRPFDLAPGGR